MVSRIRLAGLRRTMALLFLLVALLLIAPGTQAKNPYNYTDDIEGDPGDGVLQPRPQTVPEPEPSPTGYNFPVFALTLVDLGNNQFLPVFQVSDFSGAPVFMMPMHLRWNISEGRWHRAP